MPGTQTNNYDLVIELAENAIGRWMKALLDSPQSNGSTNIFEQLFGQSAFTLNIGIEHPAGVAGNLDVLAVEIGLEGVSLPPLPPTDLSISFAVEVKVDRHVNAGVTTDSIIVDFQTGIHALTITPNIPIIGSSLENQITTLFQGLGRPPLFSSVVDPTSTDAQVLAGLDLRLIDDLGPQDRDALAILLSFGGASGQNRNGFQQSVVEAPNTGAILIFFGWLCRILAPRLEAELGLAAGEIVSGPDRCEFNGDKVLDEDEDVHLKLLSITLVDGAVRVTAEITKSGFCYDATGKVSAELKLAIQDGQLVEDLTVDHPEVEIDVPWYCWLGAIALGVVTGGVVGFLLGGLASAALTGGIIGAVVGGVLVPLLLYLLTSLVKGVVENVGTTVKDKIEGADPNLIVPLPGLNIFIQDVRIDDITLDAMVTVEDTAPIRCQGEMRLRLGEAFDCDTGEKSSQGEADFMFQGDLQALCNTKVARLGVSFSDARRFDLYPAVYHRRGIIRAAEFLQLTVVPFPPHWETHRRTYGYVTTQGRWGLLQILEAEPTFLKLRFRTYGGVLPGARIIGDFGSPQRGLPWDLLQNAKDADLRNKEAIFQPHPWRSEVAHLQPVRPATASQSSKEVTSTPWRSLQSTGVKKARRSDAQQALSLVDGASIGKWSSNLTIKIQTGHFTLATLGLGNAVKVTWSINGLALANLNGKIQVDGADVVYTIQGRTVVLRLSHIQPLIFSLEATAVGDQNQFAKAFRCLEYTPKHQRLESFIPPYKEFTSKYRALFGKMGLPEKS